jgi:polyisoprenyl-teichoic acid--peptidoglycan teichoic acid transferase
MTHNQHRPGLTRLGVVGLLLVVIASLLAGCAPASPPTATTGPTTSLPSSPIQSNPDGQFAVLLLGYGGPGHDGPYLTDSMMVVIVNPAKKSLTLLSLPRDSWVPLSFTGSKPDSYDKLNTAYAYAQDPALYPNRLARYKGTNGAGNMAKDTVSSILGIPIDYYLGLDFQGFRDVIDTVGGIDVVVPDSFTARYPANDNPSVNPNWTTVYFDKGPQHMNGERALQFARAREVLDNPSEATDFARATRQRIILTALKDRVVQPSGLLHLPQLLSIASQSSVTDYPLPAVANLLGFITSWSNVQIYQAALSTSNYLREATGPSGTYILVPRSKGTSWSAVRAFARRLWNDPEAGMAMASTEVLVVNRSGQDGLAGAVSDRLAALGYEVAPPETGTVQAKTDVLAQSGGQAGALIGALSSDLALPALRSTADKPSDPGRVVLELGQDAPAVVNASQPPADPSAPTSEVGVAHFGWAP